MAATPVTDPLAQFEYAGFWKRSLINIVDLALTLPLLWWWFSSLHFTFEHKTIVPSLLVELGCLILRIGLTTSFGGTPGTLLLGMRVVDRQGQFISLGAAIVRSLPQILSLGILAGQLRATLHALGPADDLSTYASMVAAFQEHGGIYLTLDSVLQYFCWLDIGAVLFNKRKRALHDFLAGSYVVTRDSYLAARGVGPAIQPRAALPARSAVVTAFALVQIVFATYQLLYVGLFHLLPTVASGELRAAGWSDFIVRDLTGIAVMWLGALGALIAGIGLFNRCGWARAWIVCLSVAVLLELAVTAAQPHMATQMWAWFAEDMRATPIRLAAWVGQYVVALAGLWVILLYEPRRVPNLRTSRQAWKAATIAVVTLSTIAVLSRPEVWAAGQEWKIARTAVGPGTGTLVVVPRYDSETLANSVDAPALVTLNEAKTRTRRQISSRLTNGAIRLTDVPTGIYNAEVVIGTNRENGLAEGQAMPGDYESWGGGRAELLADGQVATAEVQVFDVIRLRSPEDTGAASPRANCRHIATPVEFSWDAVPRATSYRCSITRRWPDRDRWRRDYVTTTVGPEPHCRLELPAAGNGAVYELEVDAIGKTGQLSHFRAQGTGWQARNSYCFTVGEPYRMESHSPGSMDAQCST